MVILLYLEHVWNIFLCSTLFNICDEYMPWMNFNIPGKKALLILFLPTKCFTERSCQTWIHQCIATSTNQAASQPKLWKSSMRILDSDTDSWFLKKKWDHVAKKSWIIRGIKMFSLNKCLLYLTNCES